MLLSSAIKYNIIHVEISHYLHCFSYTEEVAEPLVVRALPLEPWDGAGDRGLFLCVCAERGPCWEPAA